MTIAHMSKRVAMFADGRMSFKHFVVLVIVFVGGAILTQYQLWRMTTQFIDARAHELQQPVRYPSVFSNLITESWVPGFAVEVEMLVPYQGFAMALVLTGLAAIWLLAGTVLIAFPSVRSEGAGWSVIFKPMLWVVVGLMLVLSSWLFMGVFIPK